MLAFFASKVTKKTTKFTTLQVKNVPLGSTVTAVCTGKGCPSGLKGKGFTKKNAFGTVTLAKFIKKSFKAGDKATITVSKPDAIAAVKVLTVRASKKPLISTKCIPPGTKKAVAGQAARSIISWISAVGSATAQRPVVDAHAEHGDGRSCPTTAGNAGSSSARTG